MFTVAVIGLGYVGLPLALCFAESSCSVLAVDIDPAKIASLQEGRSYIKHVANDRILKATQQGHLVPTADVSKVRSASAIIICVPTPLNTYREPDLQFVLNTGRALAPHIAKGALVVLESTSYPGTTDSDLRFVLEEGSKMTAGIDFYLAFSPEREDPGNPQSNVKLIPKVVGGLTPLCLEKALDLYNRAITKTVPVSSCRVAEATKILENTYRAVNIALVNELKIIYAAMGIDIWEVIDAAKTKPFGFSPFYPGPGLGGHCIPIDPFYLTWKAREYGKHTRFIELAGEINVSMPDYVVNNAAKVLNKLKKCINGSSILILGLAYKPDVDDCRESPAFVLFEKFEEMGATISYNDPYFPVVPRTREHAKYAEKQSVPVTEAGHDAVVLCTHHTSYRSINFSKWTIPLIDTRNCVSEGNRPKEYIKS